MLVVVPPWSARRAAAAGRARAPATAAAPGRAAGRRAGARRPSRRGRRRPPGRRAPRGRRAGGSTRARRCRRRASERSRSRSSTRLRGSSPDGRLVEQQHLRGRAPARGPGRAAASGRGTACGRRSASSASRASVSSSTARVGCRGRAAGRPRRQNSRYSRRGEVVVSPKTSGDQPMRARTASGSVTGSKPATRTSPASGTSSVASTSSSVVLPAPLGPTRRGDLARQGRQVDAADRLDRPKLRRTPLATTPGGCRAGGGGCIPAARGNVRRRGGSAEPPGIIRAVDGPWASSCRSTAAPRSPTPSASSGSPSGSSPPARPATRWSSWSPRWATRPTSCSTSPSRCRRCRRAASWTCCSPPASGSRWRCWRWRSRTSAHEARSFTGSQAGVITDSVHGKARIIDVTPGRIRARWTRARSRSSPASRASARTARTSPRSAAAGRTPPPSRWPPRSAPRSARSTPTSTASSPPTRGSCPKAQQIEQDPVRGDAGAGRLRRQGAAAALRRVRPPLQRPDPRPLVVLAASAGTMVTGSRWRTAAVEQAIISGVAHDLTEAKVTVVGVPDKPGEAAAIFRRSPTPRSTST